ncbi:NRDE family protein [Hydrogenophaga laconesensis]|uniref:Uncharacterized protein with NRDE domain n=1 Tax=Hydrogenophaga laconesensis TaxID=1805971 RepID=A0ABU1VE85_9BURK|nr:NRDE family protein [Hydrogenophaga laconesensis]MDR7095503.1 uncharacterized protein with NRDE domain [Hydrogenophaga laconesensis]
MCLIAFALNAAPGCPLLIAANRDEFLNRPTAALHRWNLDDGTEIVAGRDLRDGGTWLGLSPAGRVAMLTNVRQPLAGSGSRSRGELVTRWLQGDGDEDRLAGTIDPSAYGGFNLVVGDFHRQHWTWLSNRDPDTPHETRASKMHRKALSAGIYGLSNASLDTPWPKTLRLKQAVTDALTRMSTTDEWMLPLARSLSDGTPANARELPHTGVPDDMERALSSAFVCMPGRAYGTRSSLVVSARPAGSGWDVHMDEWTYPHTGPGAPLEGAQHHRETLNW